MPLTKQYQTLTKDKQLKEQHNINEDLQPTNDNYKIIRKKDLSRLMAIQIFYQFEFYQGLIAIEEIKNQTEQIQEHAKGYVESYVEYYKLHGFKILMQSTTMMVKFLLIGICLGMVILFGSIAVAFAIGAYLDNIVLGFLSVGGFYLLVTALLFLVKDKIVEGPILERFSTIFFND